MFTMSTCKSEKALMSSDVEISKRMPSVNNNGTFFIYRYMLLLLTLLMHDKFGDAWDNLIESSLI